MLRTIEPPVSDPVLLDEMKRQLRVDFTDDDELISGLIAAATVHAQNKTQRRFITQTLELVLQDWGSGRVKLPIAPVAKDGVLSIKYVDFFGITQTLDPSAYVVKTDGYTVSIIATHGTIWPIVFPFSSEPIVIQFVAGSDIGSVPVNVKHAIKMIAAHLYENRAAVVVSDTRAVALNIPLAADDLLLAESWS